MNQAESEALFGRMLDGEMPDEAIAATLIELAERGETAEEVAGAVRAMRARMKRITAPAGAIDVCGTGGDGQHSLNVSTAVALVVAACEVPVAKHGNRAASSLAGGADTLEALGLNLARASDMAEETLTDLGIAFLFAQAHHPALGRIAPIRKALGRRTIFNLLGPLANPAGVTRQLVGVSHPSLIALYRDAKQLLGTEAALIVSGALVSMPHISRKLASSAWPCSVAMLSGWNCTPWIGRLAWRKPITWPSSEVQLITRLSGTSSTISE